MNEQTKDDQPLVLAVETATRAGGVALARGETVLASTDGDASVSHSANLIEMIETVLSEPGLKLSEVDLFAVAVGPGSFTGLRIGLATVKAFASHLHRKLAGVSTLAAIAHASRATGEVICLLPAGRGEVFAQRFLVSDSAIKELDQAQHLSPRAVMAKYDANERLIFADEGSVTAASFGVPSSGGIPAPGSSPQVATTNRAAVLEQPLAPSIAVLGYRAYREGNLMAPEYVRAAYVRASDAEINERWQQRKAQQRAHS